MFPPPVTEIHTSAGSWFSRAWERLGWFPPPVTEIHTSAQSATVLFKKESLVVSASCHGDSHLSPTAPATATSAVTSFPPPVTEIHTSAIGVWRWVTCRACNGFRLLSRRFTPQPPKHRPTCPTRQFVSASCHGDSHLSPYCEPEPTKQPKRFRLLSRRFTPQPRIRTIWMIFYHPKVSASCHGDSHLSLGTLSLAKRAFSCFRLLSRRFTPQPVGSRPTLLHVGKFPPPVTEIHTSAQVGPLKDERVRYCFRLLSRRFTPQPRFELLQISWELPSVSASCHGDSHLSRRRSLSSDYRCSH